MVPDMTSKKKLQGVEGWKNGKKPTEIPIPKVTVEIG